MNKKEYVLYEEAVNSFFRMEGINSLSTTSEEEPVCLGCKEEQSSEPFFSWSSCDCCGSTLGGNRYHVSGYNQEFKQIFCYDVCPDCYYYAEYGQLDDMTMMEVENS